MSPTATRVNSFKGSDFEGASGAEADVTFQGVVTNIRGSGIRQSFTVRKVSGGVGVERTFPLHSPAVARIELGRKGKVRRAKLFYLRGKRGKAAKVTEREKLNPESA